MTDDKAPLDGCPRCLTRNNPPTGTAADGQRLIAVYRCDCGHTWRTCWDPRTLDRPDPADLTP